MAAERSRRQSISHEVTWTRDKRRVASILALALCAALVVSTAAGAQKKKGKKGPRAVNITRTVGAPIPDAILGGQAGVLTSTINAGKAFRGKRIRDVNVTVQITGTGTDSIDDLAATLQAPNGTATGLFNALNPGNLLGPLTLDDETFLFPSAGNPVDPTGLYAPWQGTAYPEGSPLSAMDDGPVRGAWNLVIVDEVSGNTNTLVSWRLNVVAGRPYQTK
jgi:subtilisin-like proprotein convertase family protein